MLRTKQWWQQQLLSLKATNTNENTNINTNTVRKLFGQNACRRRPWLSALLPTTHCQMHWSRLKIALDNTKTKTNTDFQIHGCSSQQLAMDSVGLRNTLKKRWTEKCLKGPTYAIFFKSWGFKDDKYDIPCINPIQLGPTMQKELFTSSFQEKCLKFYVHKSCLHKLILGAPPCHQFLGTCFWTQRYSEACLEHPENTPKMPGNVPKCHFH